MEDSHHTQPDDLTPLDGEWSLKDKFMALPHALFSIDFPLWLIGHHLEAETEGLVVIGSNYISMSNAIGSVKMTESSESVPGYSFNVTVTYEQPAEDDDTYLLRRTEGQPSWLVTKQPLSQQKHQSNKMSKRHCKLYEEDWSATGILHGARWKIHVVGKVEMNHSGYEIKLEPADPPSLNEKIFLMNATPIELPGQHSTVITMIGAEYSGDDYQDTPAPDTIEVRCCDSSISICDIEWDI